MKKEKKYRRFLFFFTIALLLLFVLPLNLYPISVSASIFTSEENENENETYTMWINDLGCELTDYEIHPDLWHLSITGSYTVMLNNSGDTDISIRWNAAGNDAQEEMIIPAKTVKKYSINFSFLLLSQDFSYEYEEIY